MKLPSSWLFFLFLALVSATPARAHPMSPAALDIHEQAPGRYHVQFRRSAAAVAGGLTLEFPPDCRTRLSQLERSGDAWLERSVLSCTKPLEGRRVAVRGLAELSLGALVSLHFRDGRSVQALLDSARGSLTVPRKTTKGEVFLQYLRLGVEHLLTGVDHLLFVLGILALARGVSATLWALSAFTVGHSITLCLAALSIVTLPPPPVELGIALSLVLLAHELTRPPTGSQRAGIPLFFVVASLGLLHGLGFAGALAQVGLPPHEIPLSLFAFNLGVEAGQVLACTMLAPILLIAHRFARGRENFVRLCIAYGIGAPAALWCIERALPLFQPGS